MYEMLMATTEIILKKKQQELSTVISQLEELKTDIDNN